MQKILFFETSEYTGATRVTRTLAKAAKEKYEVAFVQVGDNVREDIESAIVLEKPDLLFSSFIKINPDVISIGKQHSLYVIVRNDYKLEDVPAAIKERAIKTYLQADEIIVQTEEMKQELCQALETSTSRIKIMDNPLDEEDILLKASKPTPFADKGKFHFLWVGRKDPIKDLATLQKAFDVVHMQYPNTDLTLVTNDSNPYRWMKHADCLVISSISEASPNVLREALFLRTKVISTDCSPTVRNLLPMNSICPIQDVEAMASLMKKCVEEKQQSN